jgi:Fe-S-cluster-containing dehydrogenase component
MQKREKDGIVFVDAEACIGCKTCITACAWGVPQWDEESGKVIKCDYCMDRIDQGLEPACVTGCVTGSLKWLRPSEIADLKRQKAAKEMAEPFNY